MRCKVSKQTRTKKIKYTLFQSGTDIYGAITYRHMSSHTLTVFVFRKLTKDKYLHGFTYNERSVMPEIYMLIVSGFI